MKAILTPVLYTVIFNANNGVGSLENQEFVFNEKQKLRENNAITREGYTFLGWARKASAVEVEFEDEKLIETSLIQGNEVNKVVTLYAVWQANKYTVKFDANGGNGNIAPQEFKYDVAQALSKNNGDIYRAGYTFMGWARSSEANDAVYTNTNSQAIKNLATGTNEDNVVTLYAVWKANTYKVLYDANAPITYYNVAGTMQESIFTYDVSGYLRVNAFTLRGWKFNGWNTNKDGTGESYGQDGQEVAVNNWLESGEIKLYAKWEKEVYRITYAMDGGTIKDGESVVIPPATYTVDDEITVAVPIKVGFTFTGWADGVKSVNGAYTIPKGSYGNLDIAANWAINNYTIEFKANTGVGEMEAQAFVYNEPQGLRANEGNIYKVGSTFKGWNTKADGTGVPFTDGQVVEKLSSRTEVVYLYAVWEANKYTVKFNPNTGTGSLDDQKFVYGEEKKLSKNDADAVGSIKKTGYNFVGWDLDPNATYATYANEHLVKNLVTGEGQNNSVTLYAVWRVNNYTVVFDANGGVGERTEQTFKYDELKFLLDISVLAFSKLGHSFAGWATETGSAFVTYTNAQLVSKLAKGTADDKTLTLYAVWEANKYIVEFDPNLGEGSMTSQEFTYDVEQSLSDVYGTDAEGSIRRTGYTFAGWAKQDTAIVKEFDNGHLVINLAKGTDQDKRVVLYAVWEPNTYTVVFHSNSETVAEATQTLAYGQAKALTDIATLGFTKTGYSFAGWSNTQDGTSVSYVNKQSVKNLATGKGQDTRVNLYVVWEANAIKVKYMANDPATYYAVTGQSVMTDTTHIYNAQNRLRANRFALMGWRFTGWNTLENGNGIALADKAPVTNNLFTASELILYAQWEKLEYTITYLDKGTLYNAEGNPIEHPTKYDVDRGVTIAAPIKAGFSFIGWYVVNNPDAIYKPYNISVGSTGNIELVGKWQANTYTVNFDPNTGTGSLAPQIFYYNEFKNLRNNGPSNITKAGYTFMGWARRPDAGEREFVNKEMITENLCEGTSVDYEITLYAVWSQNAYDVVFNANYIYVDDDGDPSNDPDNSPVTLGYTTDVAERIPANPLFERKGYEFVKWNTLSNGTGMSYESNENVINLPKTADGKCYLYAIWQISTYQLTYDLKGGTNDADNPANYQIITDTITLKDPTKTGYTFMGWTTDTILNPTIGLQISKGSYGNKHFVAKWTPTVYTVTYNANMPSNTAGILLSQMNPNTSTHTYGEGSSLNINGYELEGWRFTGWKVTSDGTEIKYVDEDTVDDAWLVNSTRTLYANWERIEYAITLIANNGNLVAGMLPPTGYNIDTATFELSNQWVNRTGYTCVGWYDAIQDGNKVTKLVTGSTGDKIFYARWQANTYTVKFDANTGIGTLDNQEHVFDTPKALTNNDPETGITKEGYTFIGWSKTPPYTQRDYRNGQPVSNLLTEQGSSMFLYAVWQPNTYKVRYDINTPAGTYYAVTGASEMGVSTYTYGALGVLRKNSLRLTGWTFTGWNTLANGQGTSYVDENVVDNLATSGTVTLYAQWTVNDYEIVYALNNGTNDASNLSSYDVDTEFNLAHPTRLGYNFVGWFDANEGGTQITKITKGTTGKKTLYARWTPSLYTVIFDANTGDGTMENQGFVYDEPEKNLTANTTITKVGYTFIGWNTNAQGFGDAYEDQKAVRNLTTEESITLYAMWRANTYTVHFDANTGRGSLASQIFNYGENKNLRNNGSSNIVKDGYTFMGWALTPNAIEREFVNKQMITESLCVGTPNDNEITLYAVWSQNAYNVVFNANYVYVDNDDDPTNDPDNTPVTLAFVYDEVETIPEYPLFTRTGYMFAGWNTSPDGMGRTFIPGQDVKNLATEGVLNLYAMWSMRIYQIEYELNGGSIRGGLGSMMRPNPTSYTYETETITLRNPMKPGYVFVGWTSFNTWVPSLNVTIPQGSTGDLYFEANWESACYTVTYNANVPANTHGVFSAIVPEEGLEGPITASDRMYTSNHYYEWGSNFIPNYFRITGWQFRGWKTEPDGMRVEFTDEDLVPDDWLISSSMMGMGQTNPMLYAHWERIEYSITFIENGGDMRPDSYPTSYNIDTPTFTLSPTWIGKFGYVFLGWKNPAYGDMAITKLYAGSTGDQVFYASWRPGKYIIRFNANTGYGTLEEQEFDYDVGKHLTYNDPTTGIYKPGYTFMGWSTTYPYTTKQYNNGAWVKNVLSGDGSIIYFYAVWQPNTYSVRYNKNTPAGTYYGVTGEYEMGATTITYDTYGELRRNAFRLTGWIFTGWNTLANGQGTSYVDEEAVRNLVLSGYIELFAQWTKNSYTIDYVLNGGTNNAANISDYHVDTVLTFSNATRPGYTFAGWYTANQGGTRVTKIERGTTGNKTLYARWNVNSYTVVFNENTGDGTMNSQGFVYDVAQKLTANTSITKLGYTFTGWNTDPQGFGTAYADNESVKNLATSGSITLFAMWQANTYTVHFHPNTGTGALADQVLTYNGVNQRLRNNTISNITKTGYTFMGWADTPGATVRQYTNNQLLTENLCTGTIMDKEITLYAVWSQNAYDVVLHSNYDDGDGNPDNDTTVLGFIYDQQGALPINPPFVRNGYNFVNWNTQSNGSGASYGSGQNVMNLPTGADGKCHLYAIWSVPTYQITYNLSGGTNDVDNPTSYKVTTETITLKEAVKTGHTFIGWTTNGVQNPTIGLQIESGSYGNKHFVANWTVNDYTVTYNANVPSNTVGTLETQMNPNTSTHTYGAGSSLVANGYTLKGWKFNGWKTTAEGTEIKYVDGDTVDDAWLVNSARTLYAHWTIRTYTITYTLQGEAFGGANSPLNPATYTIDTATFQLEPSTTPGYRFISWNNSSDNTQVQSVQKGTVGNLTFYDTIELATYRVKYYASYPVNTVSVGQGAMEDSQYTYNTAGNLRQLGFALAGWKFNGWKDRVTGSIHADQAAVFNWKSTQGAIVELDAQWTRLEYQIIYNLNTELGDGMTNTVNPTSYNVDTNTFNLVDPVWQDAPYTFAGWYTTNQFNANEKVTKIELGSTGEKTLYAKWDPKSYTIVFDPATGTGSLEAQEFLYDVPQRIRKNDPNVQPYISKAGYNFLGWRRATAQPQVVEFTDNKEVSRLGFGETITLYAVWQATTYTVVYDKNQPVTHYDVTGVNSMSTPSTYTYDVTSTLRQNTYALKGWTFAGWNTDASGHGDSYADRAEVHNWSATGEVITLYAQWDKLTYNVTYNLGMGGVKGDNTPDTYDVDSTWNFGNPSRTGYTFTNWTENGSVVTGIAKGSTGNKTFTANWTANSFVVQFNANNGQGSLEEQTFWYDQPQALRLNNGNIFRDGYTFKGWGKTADATIVSYTDGQEVSNLATGGSPESNSATIFALWEPKTYKIVYDINQPVTHYNVTGTMADSTYKYDTAGQTLRNNSYQLKGWTFGGWNTQASGNGTSYANQHAVDNTMLTSPEITLYAKWSKVTYTIDYVMGGGTIKDGESVVTPPATYTVDDEIEIAAPTKTGYECLGWYVGTNSTSTQAPYMINKGSLGNITLTAKWAAMRYFVSFKANGGTGDLLEQTFYYDQELRLRANNKITREGYNFTGWARTSDATQKQYDDNQEVKNLATGLDRDEIVYLYAVWTANTYTVVFNSNYGEGVEATAQQVITYNVATPLTKFSTMNFAKLGYSFTGWNTGVTGDGTAYGDQATVTSLAPSGEKHLYAQWSKDVYTITYYLPEDPTASNSPYNRTTYSVDTPTFGFYLPTWPGHTCSGGWYDASDNSPITQIPIGSTGNKTLYTPIWTTHQYTVDFQLNGGTASNGLQSMSFYYGDEKELTPFSTLGYSKHGYRFVNWNTTGGGSGTSYEDQQPVKNLTTDAGGSVWLYAQWEIESYSITYEMNGGGTNHADNKTSYTVETDTFSLFPATREGYTFGGWYLNQDTTGVPVNEVTKPSTGNKRFYAKWTPNQYTIQYNANFGSGSLAPQTAIYDTPIALRINSNDITRLGYNFKGWDENKNATTPTYDNDGVSVTNLATGVDGDNLVILYAV